MIEHVHGNLLEADVEALVNTVNTVGVMGKGIALQFRQAYPENYEAYRKACKHNEVQPGRMLVVPTGQLLNPRYIINFPTKRHWKGKALMEDIEAGLRALVEVVKENNIHSLALPPLGCGNGGLEWNEVRPRIAEAFKALPEVNVLLYVPEGAPSSEKMKVTTKRPQMTPGRAAVISLMQKYAQPGYRLSLLEIQKLAYFLQAAGEPLKLNFVKGPYGPYAENLHHVLQRIEGHFIRGYGDRSRSNPIVLLDGAAEEASKFLNDHLDTLFRLDQVFRLIDRFEYPQGMELLATVHWLAIEDPVVKENVQLAVSGVQSWNERKKKTFPPEHIKTAWMQLHNEGWI